MLLDELVDAYEAANEALGAIGLAKANSDPLSMDDYVRAVATLRRELLRMVGKADRPALRSAMGRLLAGDVSRMSPEAASAHVADSAAALPDVYRTRAAAVSVLRRRGTQMAEDTRASAVRAYGLAIGVDLAAIDRQVLDRVLATQAFYVTNHARKRNDAWSDTARRVALQGISEGLGRDDVAAMLEEAIGELIGRDRDYFTVVAGTYLNRARQGALLTSFDAAGITQYQFEAVMDEVTTMQCRCLHGRVFSVRSALRRYTAVDIAQDPEAVKDVMPWVRSRMATSDDGSRYQQLYAARRDGTEMVVADVSRNAVGTRDDRGEYSYQASNADLDRFGIPTPPLHGRCRSTIIPIVQ